MPYEIRKLPTGQYAKVNKTTGKIVSRHPTRQKAMGSIFSEISHTGEKSALPPAADTASNPQ